SEDDGVIRGAEAGGALGNRVQHRLEGRRRAADDAKDVAGGGLALPGLGQLAVLFLQKIAGHLFPFEALRQTLLQVADPRPVILGRLAGNRGLGFLGLRGLWIPTHQPLPGFDTESAGDRLGERARVGKRSPRETLMLTTPTD